jgi:hypothetical protein
VPGFNPGGPQLTGYLPVLVCAKGLGGSFCGGASESAEGGQPGGYCNASCALAGGGGGACPLVSAQPPSAPNCTYAYTLLGLAPGVAVHARVSAHSVAAWGFGPVSAPVSATPRAPPDAPVGAAQARGLTPTTLHVTWALPPSVHGGEVLNYSLAWSSSATWAPGAAGSGALGAPEAAFFNASTKPALHSATLAGLTPRAASVRAVGGGEH